MRGIEGEEGRGGKERFDFGGNWSSFLGTVTEESIEAAVRSFCGMLGLESLEGKSFLDIGSGSGLSSLVARKLGAAVCSFDFDPRSVACTVELKARYFPGDRGWRIARGSVLDGDFMESLGLFDIVYSWGVLHHTGKMWTALENAAAGTAPEGCLFIALYNDQGISSDIWRVVKRTYCRLPPGLRWTVLYPCAARIWGPTMLKDLARGQPLGTWREYRANRGMSPWHDVVDWVGGYPFETARPEEVTARLTGRGFDLVKMKGSGGYGCNEFLYHRKA